MTSESPTRFTWLLAVALVLGLLIALLDSRPGWDDTGITAGVLFCVTVLLGAAMPRRAWVWALASVAASSTKSAPRPPVRFCTAATGSSADGSTVCVAPSVPANSRRQPIGSRAMIVRAWANLAACTIHSPRWPQPTTATLEPGSTWAMLNTLPSPVVMPQPSRLSHSSGRSVCTGNT